MARIKSTVNEIYHKLLKDEVVKKFGSALEYSHQCEKLCSNIRHATKKNIGTNTIRRFFGFLNNEFATSLKTLDILAEFSGYENWSSFIEQADKLKYEPLSLLTESQFYLNFYKIDMREEADMNYHNACRNIAFRILFNNALLEKLAAQLAKNPISQIYFFERFPYIDGLGSHYKKCIKFYLQYKVNDEAKIFGNALLFLSAFLCENSKELNIYHNNLLQIEINDTMHPFTIARYIGSQILYGIRRNCDIKKWIDEALKWNKFFLLKKNISFWHFPYYQYMICDYLNLAGEFQYSYSIISTISQFKDKKYEIEDGYWQGLEIITIISKHISFENDFKNWVIDSNAFLTCNPLFKKYLELQCLFIYEKKLPHGKKKEKIKNSIKFLVDDTGFIMFNSL